MTTTLKQAMKNELQRLKAEFAKMCADYAARNPQLSYDDIGELIGISRAELANYCKKYGVSRPCGNASPAARAKRAANKAK